jgi:hypothetical protein
VVENLNFIIWPCCRKVLFHVTISSPFAKYFYHKKLPAINFIMECGGTPYVYSVESETIMIIIIIIMHFF